MARSRRQTFQMSRHRVRKGLQEPERLEIPQKRTFHLCAILLQLTQAPARPHKSAAAPKSRRHSEHRQPGNLDPISGNAWNGEGEAIQVRVLWETLQEPQRAQVPSWSFHARHHRNAT